MYIPPKKIEYQGKVYDVDSSVKNIYKIMEWLEDDSLDEVDRAVMVVTRVFGIDAPVEQPLVEEALDIIRLGKSEEQHKQQERDMDFFHDFATIRMDIIRQYGVDIVEQNVTWDWFISAIENLDKDSVLNTKRMYRTIKLSDYKDAKQRQEIRKIKESIALPKESDELYDDSKINNMLKALTGKGG